MNLLFLTMSSGVKNESHVAYPTPILKTVEVSCLSNRGVK